MRERVQSICAVTGRITLFGVTFDPEQTAARIFAGPTQSQLALWRPCPLTRGNGVLQGKVSSRLDNKPCPESGAPSAFALAYPCGIHLCAAEQTGSTAALRWADIETASGGCCRLAKRSLQ